MKHYKRKSDFEVMELDGEWLILNAEAFTITTLNETGNYCWELLERKMTAAEMAAEMKKAYDAKDPTISHDIEAFLNDLLRHGLIEHAG